MIRLEQSPGRLVVRSRTVPTWMVALFLGLHVPLFGALWVVVGRIPGRSALECDRAAARCLRLVDGERTAEVGLAELERAEVRASRGQRGAGASLVLVTRSGRAFPVATGRRTRLEADAAALDRFLAGEGPPSLRLEYDRRAELAAVLTLVPALMLFGASVLARQTLCTVDRLVRTLTVRTWRRRSLRLEAVQAVAVLAHAEDLAERQRRHMERTGRELRVNWRAERARAGHRRVVLRTRDGEAIPATAWLPPRDDPGPAAIRLREALGLPAAP